MENLNERIFELNDEGLTAGKIAQKLRVKKSVILDILGEAANKGAGDAVEAFTEATGIKSVVDALSKATGKDCGCKARKELLNKVFPNRKLNDLLDDQFSYLDDYFAVKGKSYVTNVEQKRLVEIYNHVFNAKRKVSSCSTCVANVVKELRAIYEQAAKDTDNQ